MQKASVTGKERHRTIQEEFFCPEDARPGDVIGVTTEAGSTAEVVIPDGVECGEAFLANTYSERQLYEWAGGIPLSCSCGRRAISG